MDNTTALILASYGNQGIAELPDGNRRECMYKRSVGRPYCGDWVQLDFVDSSTVIVAAIQPRRNLFVRADRQGRKQAVASNLDQALIVIAPQPEPSKDLVERYLVAAHSLGIEPVLVINKAELLDAAREENLAPFSRLTEYLELGYRVMEVSCKRAPGIDALLPCLRGVTSILVGQSGVGKSSLANRLIADLDLQTRDLSRTTGKGTHTTTTTIMYTLPGGGRLVDSPGVWEYGLWEMGAGELAAGFPEFGAFLGSCRFNDCQHRGEPGCAIAAAVESGAIRPWRFDSYRRLLAQGGRNNQVN